MGSTWTSRGLDHHFLEVFQVPTIRVILKQVLQGVLPIVSTHSMFQQLYLQNLNLGFELHQLGGVRVPIHHRFVLDVLGAIGVLCGIQPLHAGWNGGCTTEETKSNDREALCVYGLCTKNVFVRMHVCLYVFMCVCVRARVWVCV